MIDGLFAQARLTYALLWGLGREDRAELRYEEGAITLRVPRRKVTLTRAEIHELIASLDRAQRMVGRTDLKMSDAEPISKRGAR
jgi:hypothetical protein